MDYKSIKRKPNGTFVVTLEKAIEIVRKEDNPQWYADIENYIILHCVEVEQVKLTSEEIVARLSEINQKAIRPLQSILSGNYTQFDTDKLAELESEAEGLRDELRRLQNEQI